MALLRDGYGSIMTHPLIMGDVLQKRQQKHSFKVIVKRTELKENGLMTKKEWLFNESKHKHANEPESDHEIKKFES